MTIKKTSHLYELLIRFGPDGFQGAHMKDLETVADGSEIISQRVLDPRAITEAEAGTLIGKESAKLVEAATAARAEAEAATAERDEWQAKTTAAEDASLQHQGAKVAAEAAAGTLKKDLGALIKAVADAHDPAEKATLEHAAKHAALLAEQLKG